MSKSSILPGKDIIVIIVAAVLTVALCAYFLSSNHSAPEALQTSPAEINQTPNDTSDVPLAGASVPSDEVLGFESKVGDLPAAMVGTQMRMTLATDDQGNLRVSSDIKEIFDYFLSAIELESLDTILVRINEYLNHHLEEPALSQALAILEQYIDYKNGLLELEESLAIDFNSGNFDRSQLLDLLALQMQSRNEMRTQFLEPEVQEAFFAEQQEYDNYTLEKLKVMSNPQLSEAEKQQQLAYLEQTLPPRQQALRQENLKLHELRAKTVELRSEPGNEDQIMQMRREYYGEDAALRFAQLDQERAEWQGRVDQYLAERQAILDNEGLAATEKQQQIDTLRAQRFDSREQIRVSYLEQ